MANGVKIDASPTKDFFIRMLVKDIPLLKVIPDLVDNCVDGALRIRQDGDYKGLWVRIEAGNDFFEILDNCGGISVDVARRYAFRFGRPPDMPGTRHSIGQFGIGMKRSLFKMGSKFSVESLTEDSYFFVSVDVEEWKDKPDWTFDFFLCQEKLSERPDWEPGTHILVTSLHETVAEDFKLPSFDKNLRGELESKHSGNMDKGLAITLNKIPLRVRPLEILHSDQLKPAFLEREVELPNQQPVTVKIYAGIAESDPKNCGWHVFCNGRLVLEGDKTWTTGWGDLNPRYHPQFNMFRGMVFFDSDDPELLPWNTTKDGVDADSPIYKDIRGDMRDMMRPVMNFLNELAEEKKKKEDRLRGSLAKAVKAATSTSVSRVSASPTFVRPYRKKLAREEALGNISYSRPIKQIEQAKNILEVTSNREVGEKTFDYFLDREGED